MRVFFWVKTAQYGYARARRSHSGVLSYIANGRMNFYSANVRNRVACPYLSMEGKQPMKKAFFALIPGFLFFTASAQPTPNGDVYIVNRCAHPVQLAVSWEDPLDGWRTEGW